MAGLGGQCPGKGCTFNMATQIQSGVALPGYPGAGKGSFAGRAPSQGEGRHLQNE